MVFFMKYYEVMKSWFFLSIQVGELDCATCLAFDIDKSPEPGWSPAEVETRRIPGFVAGFIGSHTAVIRLTAFFGGIKQY